MTITPIQQDDRRFYPIPNPPDVPGVTPGEVRLYASVTTIIDPLSSPGLVPWSAWLAAKTAVASLPQLVAAMLRRPCERTHYGHKHEFGERCAADCPCGKCLPCWQKKLSDMHKTEAHRRSEEGKQAHRWIEDWVLHDGVVRWQPDAAVQPYVDQFLVFIADYGLTPDSFLFTEAIAFHPEHEYAGTTDGAVRMVATASEKAAYVVAACRRTTVAEAVERGLHADVMIDWKSKEKRDEEDKKHQVKYYPPQALQLTAYRRCPKLMLRNSTVWTEAPETHGAVCVQLRLDSYTARVMDTGDRTFDAFLAQARVFAWLHAEGTRCVSSNRNEDTKPLPKTAAKRAAKQAAPAEAAGPAEVKLPAQRAPRKAAAKKAVKAAGRKVNHTMAALKDPFLLASTGRGAGLSDDEIPF